MLNERPFPAIRRSRRAGTVALALLATLLGACGGGGNPLGNPPDVTNTAAAANGAQILSFLYFQRCVNPIFITPQTITLNGTQVSNTCAAAGCHADATGRGGAFRVVPGAQPVATDGSLSEAQMRATDMYKNFYSAMAETVIGSPSQSLLVNKPLLRNVLHGGGLIFASDSDPNIVNMSYWISNPMPSGQDEFSTAGIANAACQ